MAKDSLLSVSTKDTNGINVAKTFALTFKKPFGFLSQVAQKESDLHEQLAGCLHKAAVAVSPVAEENKARLIAFMLYDLYQNNKADCSLQLCKNASKYLEAANGNVDVLSEYKEAQYGKKIPFAVYEYAQKVYKPEIGEYDLTIGKSIKSSWLLPDDETIKNSIIERDYGTKRAKYISDNIAEAQRRSFQAFVKLHKEEKYVNATAEWIARHIDHLDADDMPVFSDDFNFVTLTEDEAEILSNGTDEEKEALEVSIAARETLARERVRRFAAKFTEQIIDCLREIGKDRRAYKRAFVEQLLEQGAFDSRNKNRFLNPNDPDGRYYNKSLEEIDVDTAEEDYRFNPDEESDNIQQVKLGYRIFRLINIDHQIDVVFDTYKKLILKFPELQGKLKEANINIKEINFENIKKYYMATYDTDLYYQYLEAQTLRHILDSNGLNYTIENILDVASKYFLGQKGTPELQSVLNAYEKVKNSYALETVRAEFNKAASYKDSTIFNTGIHAALAACRAAGTWVRKDGSEAVTTYATDVVNALELIKDVNMEKSYNLKIEQDYNEVQALINEDHSVEQCNELEFVIKALQKDGYEKAVINIFKQAVGDDEVALVYDDVEFENKFLLLVSTKTTSRYYDAAIQIIDKLPTILDKYENYLDTLDQNDQERIKAKADELNKQAHATNVKKVEYFIAENMIPAIILVASANIKDVCINGKMHKMYQEEASKEDFLEELEKQEVSYDADRYIF